MNEANVIRSRDHYKESFPSHKENLDSGIKTKRLEKFLSDCYYQKEPIATDKTLLYVLF